MISVMVSATLATGMVPAAAFAQSAPASLDQGVGSASPAATEIAQASETEAQQQAEVPEAGVQPLEAEAPAGQAMSGQCGATETDDVTWALVQNNADDENPTYTLSFTGKGAMCDWLEHSAKGNNSCGTDPSTSPTECDKPMCALNRPWVAHLDNITKVTISEGITRLGSESLADIKKVDSIKLPESLKYIGFGSMAHMTSLSSITLPDATKTIETSAFYGDTSLATIGFSDAGNLEEIGSYAFSGAAFSGELALPEGLKRIGVAPFERCQGVTEFVIPSTVQSYDVSSSGLNGLFNGAKGSLKKVTIKSSADLPGYMFQGQNALESVEIAGDVKSIGKSAFNNCTKLSSVSGTGSVKTFGEQAFRYDSQLRRIDLSGAETIEGWCFDRAGLINAAVPNASTIGSGAFDNCGSLSSLTLGGAPSIPSGIISSDYSLSTVDLTGVESFDKVFKGERTTDDKNVGGAFTYWDKGNRADQLTAFYFSDNDKAENATKNFRICGTHAIFASTNGGELNGETADKGSLATPKKSGYTFAGWYQDKTFETPYKNGVVVPSGFDAYTNSNLFYKHFYAYAKWNSVISFDANGGTLADSDSANRNVAEGERLGELATPTRKGYEFGGWFTEKGAGKEVNSETTPEGNATYYAHWQKTVDGSTYYVNPVVPDQTYTGKELKPAISVTKDGQSITEDEYSVEYAGNVNAGTATATVKVGNTVIGTASFNIHKAVPKISITSSEEALLGGGTVTLTVDGAPAEGELTVSCDDPSISVSKNEQGHYTAFLPNATKDYTFTASYTPKENGNYEKPEGDATAMVHVSYYDPSYPVNIDGSDVAGGSVAASPTSAVPGQKVVLTPKADAGHVLGYLKVKDANGNELELEDNGDGSFSFVMPSGKVTVEASFPAVTFPDVDYSQWYAPGVDYMADKGLMTGYSDTGLFGVGKTLTRGELATILWRNACPEEARAYVAENAKDETSIAGSADGKFYTAAANWAVASGAITGIVREDGSLDFAAEENVTFEQLITVLARIGATDGEVAAAGADLSAFLDGANASAWSAPSLKWAADKGLVEGYQTEAGRLLAPGEDVARERVATVLMRAFEMGILK
ncbi:leucine-rich repeat protein [Ellagibacter isourolithinifaciens]|uniref:leucine-rich repeat protein n=1 Tax=Ellagibacter isourolithinifaciens TaxID=2137581 RepID=UPI003A941380